MPLTREQHEQIATRRAAEHESAERDRRLDFLFGTLQCLGWAALGIFCILWSAHTTDLTWGTVAFFGGLGMGNGGVLFTLLAMYRRGERRGDW